MGRHLLVIDGLTLESSVLHEFLLAISVTCDLNEIENEIHFIFYCPFYDSLRQRLFNKVDPNYEFVWLDDSEKLKRLFHHEIFSFASFIEKAWSMRRRAIYM